MRGKPLTGSPTRVQSPARRRATRLDSLPASREWQSHSWEPCRTSGFDALRAGRGSEFKPARCQIPKRNTIRKDGVSFWNDAGRGSNRARAKREKRAGGTFWCPRACRGAERRERASSPTRLCPRCASRPAATFVAAKRGAALKAACCICHRQRCAAFPVENHLVRGGFLIPLRVAPRTPQQLLRRYAV